MNKKVLILIIAMLATILCLCGCTEKKENESSMESDTFSQTSLSSDDFTSSELESSGSADSTAASNNKISDASSEEAKDSYSDGEGLTIQKSENTVQSSNSSNSSTPISDNSSAFDSPSSLTYSNYMDKDGDGYIDGNF